MRSGGPAISILARTHFQQAAKEAVFFVDLHLGQLVRWRPAGREESDPERLSWCPLSKLGEVRYRKEMAQGPQKPEVVICVRDFAEKMRWVRSYLRGLGQPDHEHYRERCLLDSAENYCGAVRVLAEGLDRGGLRSHGLEALRAYLATYVLSGASVSSAGQ